MLNVIMLRGRVDEGGDGCGFSAVACEETQ